MLTSVGLTKVFATGKKPLQMWDHGWLAQPAPFTDRLRWVVLSRRRNPMISHQACGQKAAPCWNSQPPSYELNKLLWTAFSHGWTAGARPQDRENGRSYGILWAYKYIYIYTYTFLSIYSFIYIYMFIYLFIIFKYIYDTLYIYIYIDVSSKCMVKYRHSTHHGVLKYKINQHSPSLDDLRGPF